MIHFYGDGFEAAAGTVLSADSGREPVREWLKSLDAADGRVIGKDIKDVEFSWPIGMPLVDSLGRGLWEVRSKLPLGRIARVLFCVEGDCMVLLHGFMKKTQKTPKQDIDLALKRKKGAGYEKEKHRLDLRQFPP